MWGVRPGKIDELRCDQGMGFKGQQQATEESITRPHILRDIFIVGSLLLTC